MGSMSFDVLIAGAGAIGCATARAPSRASCSPDRVWRLHGRPAGTAPPRGPMKTSWRARAPSPAWTAAGRGPSRVAASHRRSRRPDADRRESPHPPASGSADTFDVITGHPHHRLDDRHAIQRGPERVEPVLDPPASRSDVQPDRFGTAGPSGSPANPEPRPAGRSPIPSSPRRHSSRRSSVPWEVTPAWNLDSGLRSHPAAHQRMIRYEGSRNPCRLG